MPVVRAATIDDAEPIARVHVRTWQQAYRGLVPDEFLDAMDVEQRAGVWRKGMLSDDERPVWVAETDGEVVGFASAGPSRDEDDVGELYGIYVDANHWDTGAGRDLMVTATEWLRARHREATLWVLEKNARARRFYEKGGWFFDGTSMNDDRTSFVLQEVRYRVDLT